MINIRKSEERGKANISWLNSKHTFSFSNYYDPNYMGFGNLRVINEDIVQPRQGFDTHGHRDMEIITYVIEGALEHKDSIGNGSIIRPSDVQRMSAGTGIFHSEFNASDSNLVHLLQIWIIPEVQGLSPSYEQKNFAEEEKSGKLCLVASKNGAENSVIIHQDVNLYASLLRNNEEINHQIQDNRSVWIQLITGEILLNNQALFAGDGAAITDEKNLNIVSNSEKSEFLLFDLKNML